MNLFKRISGENITAGLDIGSHSIKLAKIKHLKDEYHLEAVGIRNLEKGVIENGIVKKKDALIEAITTLINQCDPSIVDVVISISGHGILSEKFHFKIDQDDNVEETILWEAGQRSPFDVDGITLDYKILREIPDKEELEVLLVAAKDNVMQGYIDLLYEAGLRPVAVDVDAFAVNNSYALESLADDSQGTTVLMNIGHSMTNVIFIKDGLYHSGRDVTTAGEFFVNTLHRNMNIDESEAAEVLKGKVDASIDNSMVVRTLEYAMDELASGFEMAFSYYKNSEKDATIDRMVISGGGAYISGMTKFLEERFNTVVSIANPLAYLQHDPGLFGVVNPQQISAFMAVAVGLALRKVEV